MSKTSSEGTYLNYDNILLRVYYDVALTGDYSKLLVNGTYSEESGVKVWEEILRDNCSATNNRKYKQYIDAYKEYLRLTNDYSFVKTAILRLHFDPIDHDLIKDLSTKGFRINTEDSTKYATSLKVCENQSRGYRTRIEVQKKAIERMRKDETKNAKNKSSSMQANLARVGTALGMVLPQDILLCSFNEYTNIIREKETAARKGKY